MVRRFRAAVCGLVLLFAGVQPAEAARQIVDLHTLDAYFALFAQDSNVPWKPTSIRLETYTDAPVDFAAYQVDPGDVLTAGTTARPRAVNVRALTAVARWQFTPPGGYQFQSNEIAVPLGEREGFFVIEARRGNVGAQVWINRSRIGLLTQQSPGEVVLYGADLGTGKALSRMRVGLLVRGTFVTRFTDEHGILRWSGARPVFALAQWGSSYAFASPLPLAPLPATLVGVRTDSAVVHPGQLVRVAGFARSHGAGALRPTTGSVEISARLGATVIAQKSVRLDSAGAFATSFDVPAGVRAGDYAVLAQTTGGVGAATLHVDADGGGMTLKVETRCEGACDPNADVPLGISAWRAGHPVRDAAVHVNVVRSPHVGAVAAGDADAPWGIATWYDATVYTDANGQAGVAIPHPTDGLASTYGVRVDSSGATADTRIVVPTSRAMVALALDRDVVTPGSPVGFAVSGAQSSGQPLAGATVTVQTIQGENADRQTLTLDAAGRARGTLSGLPLGTSEILVQTELDGAIAQDAGQVTVQPQIATDRSDTSSSNVRIKVDRDEYDNNAVMVTSAADADAAGDALLMFESSWGTQATVTPVDGGAARATFRTSDAPGELRVGAAFVRDGTLEWNSAPVVLNAPGRAVAASVTLDKQLYAPNESAAVQFASGVPGTVVVRLTRGAPSGDAAFDSLGDALAVNVTSTQSSAPSDPTWHAWVDSSGERAQAVNYERRGSPPADVTLAQADAADVYWAVQRTTGGPIVLPAPATRGRYTLSILKIDDDGRISAASSSLLVQ